MLFQTGPGQINSSGMSEIQQLIRKIQGDGVKVLSLSERLMQHTTVAKNLNLTSSSESGAARSGNRKSSSQRISASLCPMKRRMLSKV